jgi:hypothetical protein
VVSTSRPIEIEIENVLSVETNFWKPSRFSRRSRSTFILSRSRFLKSRLFSRDKDVSRFLSRSSRLIETFETNRDKTRFFEIFVNNRDFVEINRDFVEINRDFVEINRDILVSIEIFWILDICGRWWVKVLPWLLLAYLGLPPPPSTDFYN